jgi:hypothetical protein
MKDLAAAQRPPGWELAAPSNKATTSTETGFRLPKEEDTARAFQAAVKRNLRLNARSLNEETKTLSLRPAPLGGTWRGPGGTAPY